jgi:ribosomal protein L32
LSKKEYLDHVYEEIARLSSQCPPEFRSDANRVEFLKKAVRDEQWALSTLESHMTTPMNFTTLHTRLSSSIVLHEELLTRHTNTIPTSDTPQVAPVYYGEQYAHTNSPLRRSTLSPSQLPRSTAGSNRNTPVKKVLTCWNCGEMGHPKHLCPHLATRRSSDVLRERIKSGGGSLEAAARVLSAVMLGMDAEEEYAINSATERDDAAQGRASSHQEPDIAFDDLFPINYNNFEHVLSDEHNKADQAQDFQEPDRN